MTMMTLIVTITIIIILRSLVIICIDAYICLRKNIYIYVCIYALCIFTLNVKIRMYQKTSLTNYSPNPENLCISKILAMQMNHN